MTGNETRLLVVTIFGMVLVGAVTDLRVSLLLSLWGRTVTGTVIRSRPAERGRTATIRIVLDGKTIELDEPCFGFDCDQGDSVPVTVLPHDPTVHVAGSLREQVWTSVIATFVVAPLIFGVGTIFSILKVEEKKRKTNPS